MTTTLNLYKHQRFHLKLSVILFWSCPLFYECYYRHGALNTVEWGRIHKKKTAFKLFDNLKLEYSQIKQFEISWYSKSFSSFEFSDCINAFLAWKKRTLISDWCLRQIQETNGMYWGVSVVVGALLLSMLVARLDGRLCWSVGPWFGLKYLNKY